LGWRFPVCWLAPKVSRGLFHAMFRASARTGFLAQAGYSALYGMVLLAA
jgi:hypothetical protein